MSYEDFIARKAIVVSPAGIADPPEVSEQLYPFQRACVRWALQRGRAALFEECGLGKSPQQLEWARQVANHTGGRVLVLAPLAVARQTEREAAKFGVDASYARDASEARAPVVITNYERLHLFEAGSFDGVVLDESSILKAYSGRTKRTIVESFAETPFRLACTATPAPNDYLELGNHAEFLGVMSSHEMISRWFLPDTSAAGVYRLKGHAVGPFWDWVTSWGRCVSRPSDIGPYDDAAFALPELHVEQHVVDVDQVTGREGLLFRVPDMSATSVHREKRLTIGARAARLAELVAAEPAESWILWCDTDYEDEALCAAVPGAVSVRGSHPPEHKERALLGFTDGTHRVLVTKSKLAGFGLNWQHCARVGFVGPTFSFEAYYQAIRRTWRFGQERPVRAHVVMASTELGVWDVMQRKAAEHERMRAHMFAAARRGLERSDDRHKAYDPQHEARLPAWLRPMGGLHAVH